MNKNSKTYKAAYMKKWRAKNYAHYLAKKRELYRLNPGPKLSYGKKRYAANKTRMIKAMQIYNKRQYKKDPVFRLAVICRSRIDGALKMQNAPRYYPYKVLIGCSWLELKEHLQKQFKPGMHWKNHSTFSKKGKRGIHIDHIKPIGSFDLSYGRNQLKAFNYKNMQPLFIGDHCKKTCKYMSVIECRMRARRREIREYKKALKSISATV